MPDSWSNIVNNLGAGGARAGGQSALPAPGSVVMASVEEDHGDGVYTIRWAGNRLNVTSQAKLSTGSSLILKAELSPEGKTMLVVQGPALPSPDLPIIAAGYGPASKQRQEEQQAGQTESRNIAGEETTAPGQTLRISGESLSGAVLKPLLEQLPDFFKQSEMLLKAALAELERLVEKSAEATREEREELLNPEKREAEKRAAGEIDARLSKEEVEKLVKDVAAKLGDSAGASAKVYDTLKEAALRAVASADPQLKAAIESVIARIESAEQRMPGEIGAGASSEEVARLVKDLAAQLGEAAAVSAKVYDTLKEAALRAAASADPQVRAEIESALAKIDAATQRTVENAPPANAPQQAPAEARPLPAQVPTAEYQLPPTVDASTPQPARPDAPPQTAQPAAPPSAEGSSAPPQTTAPAQPEAAPPPANAPQQVPVEARPLPAQVPTAEYQPPPTVDASTPQPVRPDAPPQTSQSPAPPSAEGSPAPPQTTAPAQPEAVPPPTNAPQQVPVEARPLPAQVPTVEYQLPPSVDSVAPQPVRPDAPPQTSQNPAPPPAEGSSAPPQTATPVQPEAAPPPANASQQAPVEARPLPAQAPTVEHQPPPTVDASTPQPVRPDAPPQTSQPAAPPPAEGSPAPPQTTAPAQPEAAPPPANAPQQAPVEARPLPAQVPTVEHQPPPTVDASTPQSARPEAPPQTPQTPQAPAQPPASQPVPESVLVDALQQLAKTAELPLGGGVAEIVANSGGRTVVPEAVADKAASILLTAAGLTPGPATIEAAKILMQNNAQVDRNSVQLMLSLAAGTEGAEREATLKATARLLAHDIPVSQPLVSGLADVLTREAGVADLLAATDKALSEPIAVPEVKPLADAARELLAMLTVDLEAEGASAALERFVSSFGREALARALSLVETAAQAALENHPDLPKIDAAIAEVLARLTGETPPGESRATVGVPEGEAALLPGQIGARPEGAPAEARPPGQGQGAETAPPLPASREALPHPGVNPPSFELLRPGGPLEKYLAEGAPPERAVSRDVDRTVSDLLSDSPEKRQQATRELASRDAPFLRELSSRLMDAERAAMRSEPLLTRLAEAANSLRELGRQLLAVKAENLAGQERNPGVMLAEVPFKLNNAGGDGRMQMFYRKGGAAKGGWSSRVILDLNTTVLGPVLGDMRFFGKDMVLNVFVDKKDTADFLAAESGDLTDKLLDKGFRVKSRFMVLPPAPPPPQITAERPEQLQQKHETGTRPIPSATAVRDRRGRLDTKA